MKHLGCGCDVDDVGVTVKACADQDVLTIVGRRACGCAVAAMVAGDPATTDYGELAKWKRSGLTLENRTVGWVRHTADEAGGIRTCPHRKRRRR